MWHMEKTEAENLYKLIFQALKFTSVLKNNSNNNKHIVQKTEI